MATYISLLRFTEQGAKNIKKSTNRAHEFDQMAAKADVKIEGQYSCSHHRQSHDQPGRL